MTKGVSLRHSCMAATTRPRLIHVPTFGCACHAPRMTSGPALLHRLEQYYDAVPRRRARAEAVGSFTLFVADSGWPYYARPRLGESDATRPSDVRRVLDRQRELGVPRSLEWVHEVTPGLAEIVESVGVPVARCPLLVLDGEPRGTPGTARMLDGTDEKLLVLTRAAICVSFENAGTAAGAAGIVERDATRSAPSVVLDDAIRRSVASGDVRIATVSAADAPERGPVGGGSYSPVGDVAEVTGVAVLPAYRRRGLAAQVTCALATDALARGVTTVFCSAESDGVVRVYEGIGFRRVGTACIAEAS